MPRKTSDAKRAQVIAALLAGQGAADVARTYKLSQATVSRIKRGIREQLKEVDQEKRDLFGEMIADYLKANFETLTAQAKFCSDEKWLRQQSAENLAVLHGVMTDKAIRILEAAERVQGAGVAETP